MDGPIEVIALRRGYYGILRERGETFHVTSQKDVGAWMMLVKRPEPVQAVQAEAVPVTKPARTGRATAR